MIPIGINMARTCIEPPAQNFPIWNILSAMLIFGVGARVPERSGTR